MGFLDEFGGPFPKNDVVIVRSPGTQDEQRIKSRAILSKKGAQFDLDTPIYVGDIVEVSDPRGGVIQHRAKEVHVHQREGHWAQFSHIEVVFGHQADASDRRAGTTVNIHGGNNQLAWDNKAVQQSLSVGWPSELGAVLSRIISEAPSIGLDDVDLDILTADAESALASLNAGEPATARRRHFAAIKGILSDVASGAAQGLGQGAVAWAQAALGAIS